MNLFQWLKQVFRRRQTDMQDRREVVGTIPPEGRSSVEEPVNILTGMSQFMDAFDGISPVIPWDYLEFLTKVAIVNPDLSHAIKNWVNLANNGHHVILVSGSDQVIDAAQQRLNEKAFHLYHRSGGVDGLINHYLYDLAVSGAISSEDVVQKDLRGVAKVAVVPARKIRFKWEEEDFKPYQRTNAGEMIPLNEHTYSYFAYQVIENSPYAKPPIVASIDPILRQQDMMENIKFVMKKFGLLGLTALTLSPPTKLPNESAEEHRKRAESYASDVINALQKNFNKGLMVKFEDQNLEHYNITGNAQGAQEIMIMNEEQVASGIGVDSSILGRSYHSTETFANVMYMFMIRDANSFRRLVKRRQERTYRLDLLLAGIPVEDVSIAFNPNPARDPQSEAQAEQIQQKNVIEKVNVGLIDPDSGAQELGYNEWFDVSKIGSLAPSQILNSANEKPVIIRKLNYDRDRNKYVFHRPRIVLNSSGPQQPATYNLISDDEAREVLDRLANNYIKAIKPFLKVAREEALDDIERFLRRSRLSEFRDEEHFAERIYLFLLERYPEAFSSEAAKNAITENVDRVYRFYRLEDTSVFAAAPGVEFVMDHIDNRTVEFADKLDNFYLSKFVSNSSTENALFKQIEQKFLQEGEGLFGRISPETTKEFLTTLNGQLIDIEDVAAKRIINTGVQRLRNWAHIGQMAQDGIELAEVFNASPEAAICKFMNGKTIRVGVARQAVENFIAMSPPEFEDWLHPVTPTFIQQKGIETAVRDGDGFPPYHPNCHTRLIAKLSEVTESDQVVDISEIYHLMADAHWHGPEMNKAHLNGSLAATPD